MTDRLIRITTALAVATVAGIAAVISYRHAYELVSTHGETGLTARLVPFTVDGLILAASMLTLDASRRNQPVPPLARWCLGTGIAATISANLAHGLGMAPSEPWSARGLPWRSLAQLRAFPGTQTRPYPGSRSRLRCCRRHTRIIARRLSCPTPAPTHPTRVNPGQTPQ